MSPVERAIRQALEPLLGPDVDPDRPLRELGLDSLRLTALAERLSSTLGRPLPASALYEMPTLRSLVRGLERPLVEPMTGSLASDEPIAIVGMSCRLPGGVDSPEAYWSLLLEGRSGLGPRPDDRPFFDDALADSLPERVRSQAGWVRGLGDFDAELFSVSPREARQMDPQQRLALELSWEALEDGLLAPDRLDGTPTGVFVGAWWSDYARLTSLGSPVDPFTATGQDTSVIAGRIAYLLGLRGPTLTVNTACSSALVAVHLAVESLRRGECSIALAGGVNVIASAHSTAALHAFGGLSPDGRCKAFDARADGYVRGEGGGMVALARRSEALRRGLPIHAIVRGSAINQDGRSQGLTAPNPAAQRAVYRDALARAGASPDDVSFVEAHGTGTALGDPIELASIGAVYGRTEAPVWVGSAKTNLGHLEAAAGVAGLIKAVLSLERRTVPPSLHFEAPNPRADLPSLGLRVPTAPVALPETRGEPLAAVSAFGFSGTNAHVLLERVPQGAPPTPGEGRGPVSLLFSGHGSQWSGMGLTLLRTAPAFRRCFLEAAEASGLDLVGALLSLGERSRADVVTPLLVAWQIAAASQLSAWGVRFASASGQSIGEISAACVAGALSVADAMRVAVAWGRAAVASRGGLLVLGRADGPFEPGEGELPFEIIGRLPGRVVVAGDEASLEAARAWAQARGLDAAAVAIDYPAHSSSLGAAAAALADELRSLSPTAPAIAWQPANLSARSPSPLADGAYWASCFASGWDATGLRGDIEVSPHPLLAGAVGAVPSGIRRTDEHRALARAAELSISAAEPLDGEGAPAVISISAHSPEALAAQIERLLPRIDGPLACASLARGRARLPLRVTALLRERDSIESLAPARAGEAPAVGFVFGDARRGAREAASRLARHHPAFRRAWASLCPEGELAEAIALGLSLESLYRGWGIEPAARLGLGLGEITAAIGSGVFSFDEGLSLARAWAEDEAAACRGLATWAVRRVPEGAELVAALGDEHALVTVPEGQRLDGVLLPRAISPRRAHPEAWLRAVSAVKFRAPDRASSDLASPGFWRERPPAHLPDRVRALHQQGVSAFVELGLPSGLAGLVAGVAGPRPAVHAVALPRPEEAAVRLDRAGVQVDWAAVHEGVAGAARLPTTPFQRRRYWLEVPPRAPAGARDVDAGLAALLDDPRIPDEVRAGLSSELRPPRAPAWTVAWEPKAPGPASSRHQWSVPDGHPLARALSPHAGPSPAVVCLAQTLAEAVGAARRALAEGAPLWLVTRGAVAARPDDAPPEPEAAAIAGFGRAFAAEAPSAWGGLVDVAPGASWELVARSIVARDGEESAVRAEGRFVPRITPARLPPEGSFEGTVLVTGGLGAIGGSLATYAAARGARHVVLGTRGSGESERATSLRARIEALGARASVVSFDVADRDAVIAVVRSLPDLTAVIHAAGEIAEVPVAELDEARLESMVRPKLRGGQHLDEATRDRAVRLLLVSSVAALLGGKGYAAYVAANASLDALAERRRRAGLPAVSVAFGPWAVPGAPGGLDPRYVAPWGHRPLARSAAIAALGSCLGDAPAHLLVTDADWSKVRELEAVRGPWPLLDKVAPRAATAGAFGERLSLSDAHERKSLIAEALRQRASSLLGVEQARVSMTRPLPEQGLASILAIQLLASLEAELGLRVYAKDLVEHPSIDGLAEHLASGGAEAGASGSAPVLPPGASRWKYTGPPDPAPADGVALLVSPPRSGSTLLRVMLAGHPGLFVPPELHLLPFADLGLRERALKKTYLDEGLLRAVMELWGEDADAAAGRIAGWGPEPTATALGRLRERLGGRLLIDKSPTYALFAETLSRAERLLPTAKVIHLVRHPYAVIESIVRMRLADLLFDASSDHERVAEAVWLESTRNALAFCGRIGPDRSLLVRFEDLVREPERELRRMCAFLGLPFDPAVLDPYDGERMTGGVREGGLSIGDPNFRRRERVDPSLADGWRRVRLRGLLHPDTCKIASSLGYELPTERAADALRYDERQLTEADDGLEGGVL